MLYPSELQARGCLGKEARKHFPVVILSLIGETRQYAR
jgi:hypothetical protein